jgi:hypothetical protein
MIVRLASVPLAASDPLSFGQFAIAVVLAAALSMWVYWHASRHGSRHATAWGILTFLAVVPVLIVYVVHYYVNRRRF